MTDVTIITMEKKVCPYCRKAVSTGISMRSEGRKPGPGGYALCFHCGGILLLGPNLELLKVDADGLEKLRTELPNIWARMVACITRLGIHNRLTVPIEDLDTWPSKTIRELQCPSCVYYDKGEECVYPAPFSLDHYPATCGSHLNGGKVKE